jgi:ribonuclease HI
MCAIHFACDLIESTPMDAYIILTDSLASIEGLKSTGISYRTNDMLFRTRRSLRYLGELVYDISMMWIPSHVGIQGNERADFVIMSNSKVLPDGLAQIVGQSERLPGWLVKDVGHGH